MQKLSAKWVPKCLNADQKRQRCQSSEQLVEFFRRDPNDFLTRMVTMDETWLHHSVGSSTSQADRPVGRGSVALRLISLNHATTRKELSHAHTWEETGAVSPVTAVRQPPTRTRHLAVGLQTHSTDSDEILNFRSALNAVDKYNFRSHRNNVVTKLYTKIE